MEWPQAIHSQEHSQNQWVRAFVTAQNQKDLSSLRANTKWGWQKEAVTLVQNILCHTERQEVPQSCLNEKYNIWE